MNGKESQMQRATLKEAFRAGQDRAEHGPTAENCHPRFFASDVLVREWVRGYYEQNGHTLILKPIDRGRP